MKNLCSAIVFAGTLFFSWTVVQAAPQNTEENAWHQSRDQYFGAESWRAHMFDRIRTDLDHIQPLAFGQDARDRIANTQQRVTDLQNKMSAGSYDRPELDDVISSLEKVVADNSLGERDRDMLADDLSRVRDYRASHETWL